MPDIQAVPLHYHGVTFRSTLEADWAATFDALGWQWQYEPWAVQLGKGLRYLADFRLPGQRVWCEVKGPHDERIDKPRKLHAVIGDNDLPGADLVVILRPAGPGRAAEWHHADGSYNVRISRCGACRQWCFNRPRIDDWRCRFCESQNLIPEVSYIPAMKARAIQNKFAEFDPNADWVREWFGEFGHLTLARAPRFRRSA